jgi:hypothetical protein
MAGRLTPKAAQTKCPASMRACLTLARLAARVGFIDDVNAAFAPDKTIVAVTLTQRFN